MPKPRRSKTRRFRRRWVSDLQEICLSVIADNLWQCDALYKSTNRKYWECFVRHYTEILFQRLKDKDGLTPQHIDVLINPYMKELDLVGLNPILLTSVVEKLRTEGRSILSLKISSTGLDEKFYELLMSSLPNVEKIEFSSYCPSEIFKPIGRNCVCLKDFKLRDCEIFKMDKTQYNEGVAFLISHCPRLETVRYDDTIGALYELHKSDLYALKKQNSSFKGGKKYSLRSLSSVGRRYPLCDAIEICSVTCPSVCDLYIEDLEGDAALQKISHLTNLENAVFNQISNISAPCFSQFLVLRGEKLVSLEMPYNSCLSFANLIDCCPKLKSLKLYNVGSGACAGDRDEPSNKSLLPNLEMLEFTRGDFTSRGAATPLRAILLAARNIRRLSLMGSSGLTNSFVAGLDLYNVHELDLRLSDVEIHPLRGLILHGNLKKLNIEECSNIRDDDHFSLSKCSSYDRLKAVRIMRSVPPLLQSTGSLLLLIDYFVAFRR